MIKEQEFKDIIEKSKRFSNSSMYYIGYDEVKEYSILINNEDMILLCGYNKEAQSDEYYFAANKAKDLINALKDKKDFLITFIPKEWVKELKKAGFKVRNAWHDYFVYDLSKIYVEHSDDFDFLPVENSKEASDLTMMCRNNSRGFTGQTPEWIEKWITGEEDSAVETGTKHNNILIERNEDKSLAGILCTATYGEDDKCTLWVRELAVNPECRNNGIGRKLLMKAFAYGKKYGAKKAFLAADEENAGAIHLYEKVGFVASDEESQIDMIK